MVGYSAWPNQENKDLCASRIPSKKMKKNHRMGENICKSYLIRNLIHNIQGTITQQLKKKSLFLKNTQRIYNTDSPK